MRLGVIVALCAAALAATALGSTRKGIAFDHAFVIVLENHGASEVYGSPNMPYLSSLARRYAFAPNYFGVTHPSEPNYIALISGSTWGISDDDSAHTVDHPNIGDQLDAHHLTWDGYMESLHTPLYAKKHDPFAFFPHTAAKDIKPLAALRADLRTGRVGNFALVIPNLCDDMHGSDSCSGDAALERNADGFLRRWVRAIMASSVWKTSRVAIFVITDEDDSNGDNRVGAAVVTNAGRAHGFVSRKAYSHYSLLATLEWNWRLPYLAHASDPMTAFFGR